MKERPVLMCGSMVRSTLRPVNPKGQTRRICKGFVPCQPEYNEDRDVWEIFNGDEVAGYIRCPYGRPGDRLWVRETWGLHAYHDETDWSRASVAGASEDDIRTSWELTHHADWGLNQECCFWRPAIHMPRWASRITLDITDVRVERLQDISVEDCRAEGCDGSSNSAGSPYTEYAALWESINGAGSWDLNPWVWVIGFKRLTA